MRPTPERLKEVKTIVCHGPNCADGLASALILHDVIPDAEVIFCQYGKRINEVPATPNMLFCDITPPKDRMEEFLAVDAIVLDHHTSVKELTTQFRYHAYGDAKEDIGVSGAMLAFTEVWQQLYDHLDKEAYAEPAAKAFATIAGVYDTWQTHSSNWFAGRVQDQWLKSLSTKDLLDFSRPFGMQDSLTGAWWEENYRLGKVLVKKHDAQVKQAIRSAYRYNTSKGTRVLLFENTQLSNMAAEVVDQDADLIIGFNMFIENDNEVRMIMSTRSHTGYNCMEFCKQFGGGGHTAAAGFSTSWKVKEGSLDPYTIIRDFVGQHEAPPV